MSSLAVRTLFGLAFVVVAWQVWTLLGIAIVAYVLLWMLRPSRRTSASPRGTADGAVPAHRPGHRGCCCSSRAPRRSPRNSTALARVARAADRRRGAAVPVRRRSWRGAGRPPRPRGSDTSCRAASRLRRATARTSGATSTARTLAARLARARDRAARGRRRGDRAEPRRARHPPRALPGRRAVDPRGHDAGQGRSPVARGGSVLPAILVVPLLLAASVVTVPLEGRVGNLYERPLSSAAGARLVPARRGRHLPRPHRG